jgi:serine/threonine protein phosphatase PrpC
MTPLQFRIAARTDAAGKYSPTAPLEGNEDNMFIDNDLSNEQQGAFTADEVVSLSDKGCLMVVADGMGGMNAGEVASDIAIKTVTEYFSHDKLTAEVTKDKQSRIQYLEKVVVAADAAIKEDANANKEHEGMGSTIIMAWLCDGEICLTWCGDSRAYLYRPTVGLRQVSKDHSYVQDLVDAGKISETEAFDHPYGNVITRSLGDPEKKAKPDSVWFKVYEGDIFMLCSDGLSGVLRDRKTFVEGQRIDTDNLEDIIRDNASSMAQCRNVLFEAAERNDWYDNVTVILCEIVKGEMPPTGLSGEETEIPISENNLSGKASKGDTDFKKRILLIFIAILLLLGAAGIVLWRFLTPNENELLIMEKTEDTISVVSDKIVAIDSIETPNQDSIVQSQAVPFVGLQEHSKAPKIQKGQEERVRESPADSTNKENKLTLFSTGGSDNQNEKTDSSTLIQQEVGPADNTPHTDSLNGNVKSFKAIKVH